MWDSRSRIRGFVGEGWGFIPQAWGNDPPVSPRFSHGSPGCFRDTATSFETWGKVGPASTTLPQASPLIPQVSPLNPQGWGNVGEVWGINPQAWGKDFFVWGGVFPIKMDLGVLLAGLVLAAPGRNKDQGRTQ